MNYLVMSEMKYVESSLEEKTTNATQRVDEIDFSVYSPENIDNMGDYIELHGERARLERVIDRADKPYLIYGAKGLGKTQLVHSICRDKGIALVEFNCGTGTTKSDFQGRLQVDEKGSYFQRGLFPIAYSVANHFGHAVCYLDELGATEHELQKWMNRPLDSRKSCFAGGKVYRLNEGCKLTFIATTNPIEYAGVNNLTEDLKSRFIGSIWDYPSSENLDKIIDWKNIPDYLHDPLLTLAQDTYSLRTKGDVEYVLSPRDLKQFTDVYRDLLEDTVGDAEESLSTAVKEAFLIKYTDPTERELIRSRAEETLGVTFAS
tara:strand:+ start:146 stop:1099 length:954 start_codon:yes stop_codon:yes gene_type:complete